MKQFNNKIIFFGSSKYSVIDAKILHQTFDLRLVVTTPDKPTGRKNRLTPSPVKLFAQQENIPIITTEKLDSAVIEQIKTYQPDFLVVADYGLFLPNNLLSLPKYAPLNVHHSLLPKYRGSSPAPSAILNGEKVTGVSIIQMSERIDAGDILAQQEYEIKPDETTDSLLTMLNELGGKLVTKVINDFKKEVIKPIKQDESKATFTEQLTRESGYIDPSSFEIGNFLPCRQAGKLEIARKIRAYYPWPGAWTKLRVRNSELRVKFLPNNLLQLEGKKPMTYKDFLNGYPEMKEFIQKLIT